MLQDPIEFLKGVGPKKAELLKKELGIFFQKDLLSHFPFRYIDRTIIHPISNIPTNGDWVQVKGILNQIGTTGAKRAVRMNATIKDQTGSIELVWFQGFSYIRDSLIKGKEYIVFGKVNQFKGKLSMPHPEIIPVNPELLPEKLGYQPVYSTTEKLKSRGLDSRGIKRLMENLFETLRTTKIPETLPAYILEQEQLISSQQAYRLIHFPKNAKEAQLAQYRLKFEELFFSQFLIVNQKLAHHKKFKGQRFEKIGTYFNSFYHDVLPFELTNAQKRVLKEIRIDVNTGRQMNRLLQGDVGSGKTMVAVFSMLMAKDNGFQACLMAPTEILAQQHFKGLSDDLEKLDLKIALLTGSTKTAQRRSVLEDLKDGKIDFIIGTHALIEEKVVFQNLGMVIIDEQHRFGVAQRAKLWKKNNPLPHVLIMTATPIPRTLAMTSYGDLDVSIIDELPPGRKPVKTVLYDDSYRARVFGFVKEQIKLGRQIYFVYPLIEESEKLDLKDVTDGYESISRSFPRPEYQIGILHGRMKQEDKDFEMARFVAGETQILVSTTVIEVGVNVPNASVMVIESAERFGLSQLHQLRGRVGRGSDESYCILMGKSEMSRDAYKRLKTMTQTNDGFKIAEVDLELRGAGDLQGTQQSGEMAFLIADLSLDKELLARARDVAIQVLEEDSEIALEKNLLLKVYLKSIGNRKLTWGRIS